MITTKFDSILPVLLRFLRGKSASVRESLDPQSLLRVGNFLLCPDRRVRPLPNFRCGSGSFDAFSRRLDLL